MRPALLILLPGRCQAPAREQLCYGVAAQFQVPHLAGRSLGSPLALTHWLVSHTRPCWPPGHHGVGGGHRIVAPPAPRKIRGARIVHQDSRGDVVELSSDRLIHPSLDSLRLALSLFLPPQADAYSPFHSTVSRTSCAFGRNSSNLSSGAATSMSTVWPPTSTITNRSFHSSLLKIPPSSLRG